MAERLPLLSTPIEQPKFKKLLHSNSSDSSEWHSLTSSIISSRSVLLGSLASSRDDSLNESSASGGNDRGSTFSAVLNLTVSVAGGIGMVTLPGSFSAVGWAEGTALLVFSGMAAAWSCLLLNRSCSLLGDRHPSYAALVSDVLGKVGSNALELLTLLYCVGQVIAYLGAIGGQAVSLLGIAGVKCTVHQAIVCTAAFVISPLSLLPEASAMRFAGVFGTACMVYIVAVVVVGDGRHVATDGFCSLAPPGATGMVSFSPSITALLTNAPIFLFSMNAAVTYVPIRYHHKELLASATASERSTRKACNMLIVASLCQAGVFYLACSGFAYAAYCSGVPENVVNAWDLSWRPGLFARGFLALELSAAASGIYIPLGRAALWHLLYGPGATTPALGATRVFVTLGIVASGALGSMAFGGALALPLAITSALCVSAQMFVLPGLCASRLSAGKLGAPLVPGGSFGALLFALFGAAFGALSLAALFGLV